MKKYVLTLIFLWALCPSAGAWERVRSLGPFRLLQGTVSDRQTRKLGRCRRWLRQGTLDLRSPLALDAREWKSWNQGPGRRASSVSWAVVYFLMSSEDNRRVLRGMLWDLKRREALPDALVLVERFYPGGFTKLDRDWRAWLGTL